ncbi:metal ABC transporter solute-binding protein, Zn/Mn family [Mesoterricola silvestris]|uniref:Zinc ABC transporter substrate-binding protein n=1 Tax=Mesoterricola silvestris TaxID=2927979 RepID=A0AA48GT63_9BACT|nr:zinc ABC transporter substrate-binding protein [Mesoterricola silvestris]BDU73562.1 hypothetical protein METEAL_27360 [Mesoterricola silvestris]
MNNPVTKKALRALLTLFAAGGLAAVALAGEGKRLPVAVAEADVEAIVKAVGGNQVETFSLFKGCILRKDLAVEASAKDLLTKARVIVWTGFLRETEAINKVLQVAPGATTAAVQWVDVSPSAFRTNVPFSTCEGFADPLYSAGDPFFWLNPENGAVIARNVAKGLSKAAPASEVYFHANAAAFIAALKADLVRWKKDLKPLHGVRIFSFQCGWQNFSSMGGPKFIVCKATPGQLPAPAALLDYVTQMKAQIVLVDPNTPPEYVEACRERPGLTVLTVPSSLEGIPGAKSYASLFDHLLKVLQSAAKH